MGHHNSACHQKHHFRVSAPLQSQKSDRSLRSYFLSDLSSESSQKRPWSAQRRHPDYSGRECCHRLYQACRGARGQGRTWDLLLGHFPPGVAPRSEWPSHVGPPVRVHPMTLRSLCRATAEGRPWRAVYCSGNAEVRSCSGARNRDAGSTMATMGLARLLPKPQRSYQVHQDEPSPVTMAHLQVRLQQPVSRLFGDTWLQAAQFSARC